MSGITKNLLDFCPLWRIICFYHEILKQNLVSTICQNSFLVFRKTISQSPLVKNSPKLHKNKVKLKSRLLIILCSYTWSLKSSQKCLHPHRLPLTLKPEEITLWERFCIMKINLFHSYLTLKYLVEFIWSWFNLSGP